MFPLTAKGSRFFVPPMAEVRDPIHQFISLTDVEVGVIDTAPVQRLREIHQLSFGFLVWPGATHSRFEHALGTMELAGRAFEAAVSNSDPSLLRDFGWDRADERLRMKSYVRLAGLLHDVGHAPFSHGSEALFADGLEHEDMSARIILETEIAERLSDAFTGFDPSTVADIAVGPKYRDIRDERSRLLSEIVTGSVGVDRWDYLLRDNYYTGVNYGVFDVERLLQAIRIVKYEGGAVWALEQGGQYSAEQMLLARWFMFLNVYHHKTRRILDIHLTDFLRGVLPGGTYPAAPDDYLRLTDTTVIQQLKDAPKYRKLLIERGHWRMLREFSAADFGDPDDFQDFCSNLSEPEVKADEFTVQPSAPGEDDFFVIDTSGEPVSLIEALHVLRPLEPRWIGRVYGPPGDDREALTVRVASAFKEWRRTHD